MAASPKPSASVGKSNGKAVSEIDLTQDEFDNILGGSNEKPGATKTTTPKQKHSNETNKKKSSENETPRYAVRLVRITPKSPPPPPRLPSPPPTPPPQQKQTTGSPLKRRQRTRSTGVRNKVSDTWEKYE